VVMDTFRAGIDLTEQRIFGGISKLEHDFKQLELTIASVWAGIELRSETFHTQALHLEQLEKKLAQLKTERDGALKRNRTLEESIPSRIDAALRPIQAELDNARALLSEERESRRREKEHLIDIWPDGCTMPSSLMLLKLKREESNDQREPAAEERSTDHQWMSQYDEEGHLFYMNVYTGETSWAIPQESNKNGYREIPDNKCMDSTARDDHSVEGIKQSIYHLSTKEQELGKTLDQVRRDILSFSALLNHKIDDHSVEALEKKGDRVIPMPEQFVMYDDIGCHLVDRAIFAGFMGTDALAKNKQINFLGADSNIQSCTAAFWSAREEGANREGVTREEIGPLMERLALPLNTGPKWSCAMEVESHSEESLQPIIRVTGIVTSPAGNGAIKNIELGSFVSRYGSPSCLEGTGGISDGVDQKPIPVEAHEPSDEALKSKMNEHERHRHQLLLRARELRRFLLGDSLQTVKMWEAAIEDRNTHIAVLSEEMFAKETEIRQTEAIIDRLSIKPEKPQAPQVCTPVI